MYGNKRNQVKLKIKKEKDMSIYILLYLKYILVNNIIVQKN